MLIMLLAVEEKRREALTNFEALRTEQNNLSDKIPQTSDAVETRVTDRKLETTQRKSTRS